MHPQKTGERDGHHSGSKGTPNNAQHPRLSTNEIAKWVQDCERDTTPRLPDSHTPAGSRYFRSRGTRCTQVCPWCGVQPRLQVLPRPFLQGRPAQRPVRFCSVYGLNAAAKHHQHPVNGNRTRNHLRMRYCRIVCSIPIVPTAVCRTKWVQARFRQSINI
jgi:hypothetical protein